MEFNNHHHSTPSPSSSSASSTSITPHPPTATRDPVHSWWESVSKARSKILSLSSILSPSSTFLSSLADSDRPALSLLSSPDAYCLISASLSQPSSGSGSDPLCQWLYETYLSGDTHLQQIVILYVPLIVNLYMTRIHIADSHLLPSLAGFEAVLLAIYSSEAKARAGKPLIVQVPDLSLPSLYHTPRSSNRHGGSRSGNNDFKRGGGNVGVLAAPLEPQIAVKSTKRACIVGVALDCYFKQISQMPNWSKVDFCEFVAAWAGQDCECKKEFDRNNEFENVNGAFFSNGHVEIDDGDNDVVEGMSRLEIERVDENGNVRENGGLESKKGVRIPLPWELLQPTLRILGHCLLGLLNSQDVKDAASVAVRCLYARGSHDLVPQAILATRSLIQLDKRAREAAKAVAAAANASSNSNTPSKAKKPEILLVSK